MVDKRVRTGLQTDTRARLGVVCEREREREVDEAVERPTVALFFV